MPSSEEATTALRQRGMSTFILARQRTGCHTRTLGKRPGATPGLTGCHTRFKPGATPGR